GADAGGVGGRKKRGDRRENDRRELELLSRILYLGPVSGPLLKEVGLGARGLESLDQLKAAHRHPAQLAALLLEPLVLLGSFLRDPAEHDQVESRDRDSDCT